MKKFEKNSKFIFITSILSLVIALVVASCALFAWFTLANQNNLDDLESDVVGSSSLDMNIVITNSNGETSSSLKFSELVPNDEFDIKVTVFNYAETSLDINLVLSKLLIDVKKNKSVYNGITMLNAFAIYSNTVSKFAYSDSNIMPYTEYSQPIYLEKLFSQEKITIFPKFPMPGSKSNLDDWKEKVDTFDNEGNLIETNYIPWSDPSLKYVEIRGKHIVTTINLKLKFMNTVMKYDSSATPPGYVEITEAILDGVIEPVSINTYQNQKFGIGKISIEAING